jgi:hypothetical protein
MKGLLLFEFLGFAHQQHITATRLAKIKAIALFSRNARCLLQPFCSAK